MSDTAESAPAPTPAPHAQFNHPNSDLTLLSSDNVLFHVHRANLSAFSAVFKNMFSDSEAQSEPVPLSETSSTLAILLAMCYPSEEPPVDFTKLDAEVILACYEATVKYQMWVAGLALRSFVQPLVHLEPFLVVKLAYRLNDSVLMAAAAEEALNCDILANARQYAEKAGPDMWPRLLEFHYRRKMEIVDFVSTQLGTAAYCAQCRRRQPRRELLNDLLASRKGIIDPQPLQKFNSATVEVSLCGYCPDRSTADFASLKIMLAQFPSKCSFTL